VSVDDLLDLYIIPLGGVLLSHVFGSKQKSDCALSEGTTVLAVITTFLSVNLYFLVVSGGLPHLVEVDAAAAAADDVFFAAAVGQTR